MCDIFSQYYFTVFDAIRNVLVIHIHIETHITEQEPQSKKEKKHKN